MMRMLRMFLIGALSVAFMGSPALAQGHGKGKGKGGDQHTMHDKDDHRSARGEDKHNHKADKDKGKSRDKNKDWDKDWDRKDGFEFRIFGSGDRPPGWRKGNKTGWGNCGVPPGQAKKGECRTYSYLGRRYYYYHDDDGRMRIRRPSIRVDIR